jgi:hypothetical protein
MAESLEQLMPKVTALKHNLHTLMLKDKEQ